MTFEIFTWITAAVSVAGVVLNIKKHRACFVLWSVTNVAWAAVDFYVGLYAQAALFALYFGLSLWGLRTWSREGAGR